MVPRQLFLVGLVFAITTTGVLAQNTFPSSGNVGIGTTAPLVNLQINGPNPIVGLQDTGTWGSVVGMQVVGDGNLRLGYFQGSNISNSMYLAKSGNVGIGTTSPQAQLDVVSTSMTSTTRAANIISRMSSNGIGADATLKITDGWANNYLISGTQGNMYFAAGGITPQVQMTILGTGNIGIGTTSPAYSLDVVGSIHASTNVVYPDGTAQTTAWTGVICGGDYAESVDVTGDRTKYEPGDVLVIDPNAPGKFLKANQPYSTLVAGIYSTRPGTVGRRQTTPKSPDEIPMAMVGIVPAKVSAENGPIRPGDLLVTSSTLGYAMKGTDHSRMLGAVIGKALGNLETGNGVIEVVVTLQ